jgi:ssDNA-binding replication factor A large subunit
MSDFDVLLGDLLQSRPDLDRQELMHRIEEKKRTVGAGYLTDQGALFLVAGELGVSLRKADASSDLTIKDMYIGANDVTVVARVLALYPPASFKKKDGGTGKYARVVLFDGRDSAKLTLWDEKAEEVAKSGFEVGSPVRVANGYVKQGLDGKPNLNLGKRGRMEVVSDEKIVARLPTLAAATDKLTKVTQEKQFVAVECVVNSEPRYSEFVRQDGSPGSLFQFGVVGDGGKGESRMVIWSPAAQPQLKKGQKVVVTNVRSKRSSNGEYEIHGDAGSAIIPAPSAQPAKLRVAAVNSLGSGSVILALDEKRKVRVVEVGAEARKPTKDEVVIVTHDSESDGRLYCRSKESLGVGDSESLPALDALATKLRDAKDETSQVMVEVIALSHGTIDEVTLKDGSTVKKGELTIGDDTGEVKLVAWRDLSERVAGIQPGQRLRVVAVTPKSTKLGAWVLQVSNLTVIEKLKGRG